MVETEMVFNGARLKVEIEAYIYGDEPYYSFYAKLSFPDRDWDKVFDVKWNNKSWQSWNDYRCEVWIELDSEVNPSKGIMPRWGLEIHGIRCLVSGCNREGAEVLKFRSPEGRSKIKQAFAELFRENPNLLLDSVEGVLSLHVDGAKVCVKKAETRLEQEKKHLEDCVVALESDPYIAKWHKKYGKKQKEEQAAQ